MESRNILIRRSQPTEFDQHPYGTICKVSDHHMSTYDLFLQVSDNMDEPNWELFGNFTFSESEEPIDQLISARLRKGMHYD